MDRASLLPDLLAGRPAALARAMSLVENTRAGYEDLLAAIHPRLGRAHRIGVTGPPGAGKSTLTTELIKAYRSRGERVGVVAVDPTSPFSGGALLGDRIRMEAVALDDGVFIRSMATRGSLGGLATSTREVCDVLDAAGFDRILIETVGVGQSELAVSGMADTTVLVLVPESGDGIQTLKSGVMEIADLYVVNKADRPGGEKLAREIEVMLGIRQGNAFRGIRAHHGVDLAAARSRTAAKPARDAGSEDGAWAHPVLLAVAVKGDGIERLVAELDRHRAWMDAHGELADRRRTRLAARTREVVDRTMQRWIWNDTRAAAMVNERLDDVAAGRLSPYELAGEIVAGLKEGARA
ncbi:MAG: methylmalonyl Co-A mutase-associated GTPase MeaB [Gemmatimonadales bacterium]